MRLAVLADIHSNLPALEAVLADAATHDVQGHLIAGDHFTGGPFPAETARLLGSLDAGTSYAEARAVAVRGNTDNRLLAYGAGELPDALYTSAQWAALRWVYDRLDLGAWLAALPEQAVVRMPGGPPIRVVHGSLESPTQHMAPAGNARLRHHFSRANISSQDAAQNLARSLDGCDEPVLVCGHSHIAWVQEREGRLALNPGSVGTPNNGAPRAQYAILDQAEGGWRAQLRAVPYPRARVREAYEERGLLAAGGPMSRAFMLGILTGQPVFGRFVAHVNRAAQEAGIEGCPVVPEAVLARAVEEFDWPVQERRVQPNGTPKT
jgi:predicted phosphodiesterase